MLETSSEGKAPPYGVQASPIKAIDLGGIAWGSYGGKIGVWRIINLLKANGIRHAAAGLGQPGDGLHTRKFLTAAGLIWNGDARDTDLPRVADSGVGPIAQIPISDFTDNRCCTAGVVRVLRRDRALWCSTTSSSPIRGGC